MFQSDVSLHWLAYIILRQPNHLTGKHSESAKARHDPENLADIALALHQSPKPVRCCVSAKIFQFLYRWSIVLLFCLEHVVKFDDWFSHFSFFADKKIQSIFKSDIQLWS